MGCIYRFKVDLGGQEMVSGKGNPDATERDSERDNPEVTERN